MARLTTLTFVMGLLSVLLVSAVVAMAATAEDSTPLFEAGTMTVTKTVPWQRNFSIKLDTLVGDAIAETMTLALIDGAQDDQVLRLKTGSDPNNINCQFTPTGTFPSVFNEATGTITMDTKLSPIQPGDTLNKLTCVGLYLDFTRRGNIPVRFEIAIPESTPRRSTLVLISGPVDDGMFASAEAIMWPRRDNTGKRIANTRNFSITLVDPIETVVNGELELALSIPLLSTIPETPKCSITNHPAITTKIVIEEDDQSITLSGLNLHVGTKTMVLTCENIFFDFSKHTRTSGTITLTLPRSTQTVQLDSVDDSTDSEPAPGPFSEKFAVDLIKLDSGAINKRNFDFVLNNNNFPLNQKIIISASQSVITPVQPVPAQNKCTVTGVTAQPMSVDAIVNETGDLVLDFTTTPVPQDTAVAHISCPTLALIDYSESLDTQVQFNIKYESSPTTRIAVVAPPVLDLDINTHLFDDFEIILEKIPNKPLLRSFTLSGTQAKKTIDQPLKLFFPQALIQITDEDKVQCQAADRTQTTTPQIIPTQVVPNTILPTSWGTPGYSIIFHFGDYKIFERTQVQITCNEFIFLSFADHAAETTPMSLSYLFETTQGEQSSVGPIADDRTEQLWDFALDIPLRTTYQSAVTVAIDNLPTAVEQPLSTKFIMSFKIVGAQLVQLIDSHSVTISIYSDSEPQRVITTTFDSVTPDGVVTFSITMGSKWSKFDTTFKLVLDGTVAATGFTVSDLQIEFDRGIEVYKPSNKVQLDWPLSASFVTKEIKPVMKTYLTRKVATTEEQVPILELLFSKTNRAINRPLIITTNSTATETAPVFWIDPKHSKNYDCRIPEFKDAVVPTIVNTKYQTISLDLAVVKELAAETKKDFSLVCAKIGLLKPSSTNSFISLTLASPTNLNLNDGENNNDFFGLDLEADNNRYAYSLVVEIVPEKKGFPGWLAFIIVFAVVIALGVTVWGVRKLLGLGQKNEPTASQSLLNTSTKSSTSVNPAPDGDV